MAADPSRVGFVIFDRLTPLDLVGPYEVLSRCNLECLLVAPSRSAVTCEGGLRLLPDTDFESCPQLDVLVVPGGPGQSKALDDEALIAFVAQRASAARFVLGVCTGVLLLAAAGVLRGRSATTHWLAREELERLGVRSLPKRVVWDGNVVTAAGVSSGIDMALDFVAKVYGPAEAQRIQLSIEYDPSPPFASGSPDKAPAEIVEKLRNASRFAQPGQSRHLSPGDG